MTTKQVALVLGATGGVGGEVARQLCDAGWEVKALARNLDRASESPGGITWLRGDALNPADVETAARGCAVIVHAVNPPGYRNWSDLVLPMLDNTIAAARQNGALVVLPGTVYNYGRDAFPILTEDSPQCPQTRKGAIRVEMESRLSTFAREGGKVLIVRAGDFFGPRAGNSWFAQGLVKPGRPVVHVSNPGLPGVGHQWAYLPDVARTMVELIERRDQLDRFSTFHMQGYWDSDGTEMAAAISRAVIRCGGRAPQIRSFPWWLVRLASPFVVTMRELIEMRYLWRQPVRMDNAKLVAILGREPSTSLDLAVEATLRGLGCLEGLSPIPSRSPAHAP